MELFDAECFFKIIFFLFFIRANLFTVHFLLLPNNTGGSFQGKCFTASFRDTGLEISGGFWLFKNSAKTWPVVAAQW